MAIQRYFKKLFISASIKTDRVYFSDFGKDSLSAVKMTFSRIIDNGFRHKSTAINHVFRRRFPTFSDGMLQHFSTVKSDVFRRRFPTFFDDVLQHFSTVKSDVCRQFFRHVPTTKKSPISYTADFAFICSF